MVSLNREAFREPWNHEPVLKSGPRHQLPLFSFMCFFLCVHSMSPMNRSVWVPESATESRIAESRNCESSCVSAALIGGARGL